MKVLIEGKTYLENDEFQYIIKTYTGKTVTVNKGKSSERVQEDYKIEGYYGTIKQAMNAMLSKKIKRSTATTLKELMSEIEDLRRYMDNLMEKELIK